MNRDSRRTRLVLTVLVLLSITLITVDYRDARGGILGRVSSFTGAVFGPIERAVSDVVDPIGHFFASFGHFDRYKGEATRLEQENVALRREVLAERLAGPEYQQFLKLYGLAGAGGDTVVGARVIAFGHDVGLGFDYVVTIDVGTDEGVHTGDTVINGSGLVGLISSAHAGTSTVVLATAPSTVVGGRLVGDLSAGYVTGGGAGPMTFNAYSPSEKPTRGDVIVTVGPADGSSYVAGIPVGTITAVSYPVQTAVALVRPAVDFATLDIVGVVVASPPATQAGPVLPPRPTVTVTVTATPAPSPSSSGGALPPSQSPSPHVTASG